VPSGAAGAGAEPCGAAGAAEGAPRARRRPQLGTLRIGDDSWLPAGARDTVHVTA
jgi:hypothetical protein